MCGLAGFAGPGDEQDLARMGAALAHRGPDGAGDYIDRDQGVFLCHRRLAVIDLAGGAQPMWDGSGETGVVFNGEIYNHAELRRELEDLGHRFHSDHSDTEVLVHGYRAWGQDLPRRLNGMFAFVVYDRVRRRLFAARDRFGKKPFYFRAGPEGFAFASELRALAAYGAAGPEIDNRALQQLFGYGFIPAPRSLYAGCEKLPGGHWLAYDVPARRATVQPYWRYAIEAEETSRSEEDLCEELRHLLAQAVRRRLVADVPLGVLLSGGIDSSAVLAFAARAAGADRMKTFSIGFDEPSFDETRFARAAAAGAGAQHGERVLALESAYAGLPAVLRRLDEPNGDSSILPTHHLAAFARESVTVALGGDGSDELFAGYDTFRAVPMAERYERWFPRALRGIPGRLAARLPVSHDYMSLGFRLQRALRGVARPQEMWNPLWLAPAGPDEMAQLFEQPLAPEELYADAIDAWRGSAARSPMERSLEFYARFYLQDGVLAKVDRASMAVALEVRAPFLDNDLVEFARRLPLRFKYRNGTTKYLLKRALRGIVPDAILARRKQGFAVPIGAWFKKAPAGEDGNLAVPGMRPEALQRAWREHRNGRADHRQLLWCAVALRHHMESMRAA
jgi:asparagine synthase (glutamine-hydrolysing)